ncbi:MAG: GGDEF domain-containing protein [Planctomycetaceae bacterium]|nr:GGDEF domain-containing protein [Planctomycetaceae bacterium]
MAPPSFPQAAFELLPDAAFCIARPSTAISGVNAAACAEVGYPREELLGARLDAIISRDDVVALATQLNGGAPDGASAVIRATQRQKDGTATPSWWRVSQAVIDGRDYWIAVARPVAATESFEAASGLGRLGHDPLTGLPDRRLFHRRLDRAIDRAREHDDYRFAVLFVDLDGFKQINDQLGHLAGDRVLCDIACHLAGCTRPSDMTARYGGDEFTVLVDDLRDAEHAILVADRILQQIAGGRVVVDGQSIHVSASVGIAMSSSGGCSADALLYNADRAMYRAKSLGLGRALLYEEHSPPRPIKPR